MGKSGAVKKKPKKELQHLIFLKLSEALEQFKSALKPKKTEAILKKMSKLFAAEIVKATVKKKNNNKKSKKKEAGPKTETSSHNEPAALSD